MYVLPTVHLKKSSTAKEQGFPTTDWWPLLRLVPNERLMEGAVSRQTADTGSINQSTRTQEYRNSSPDTGSTYRRTKPRTTRLVVRDIHLHNQHSISHESQNQVLGRRCVVEVGRPRG